LSSDSASSTPPGCGRSPSCWKVLAPAADAVHLLGHVDQLKIGREGAHQLARQARRPPAHAHRQRIARAGNPFAPADGRQPVLLDQRQQLLAALLAQHLAHELPERMDVLPQRVMARREFDIFAIHGGRHSNRN
jgi:hypothetical protein